MEELTLVHPNDTESKVVVSNPIQVAAYKSQGYVEESDFAAAQSAETTTSDDSKVIEELQSKLDAAKKKLVDEKTARKDAEAKLGDEVKAREAAEQRAQDAEAKLKELTDGKEEVK